MNTLIINGSPRKLGDSITLINEMKKYLKGSHIDVNTYYDDISPCIDCRYCWSNEGCCIDDKMQDVYTLLNEVDNVIIASPLYFSELTGELLNFASRLQMVYAQQSLRKNTEFKFKRKNGVLILVGGGDKVTKPAEIRAQIIFNLMNVKLIESIFSLETNILPAKEDNKALEKAKEVALLLNQLY